MKASKIGYISSVNSRKSNHKQWNILDLIKIYIVFIWKLDSIDKPGNKIPK